MTVNLFPSTFSKLVLTFLIAEKIKEDRGMGKGNPIPCVHRDRPVEESLREFERMKNGEYKEKEACLRMKMDLNSGNPYMWDTVAYRVKNAPHHRTGDKWSKSSNMVKMQCC